MNFGIGNLDVTTIISLVVTFVIAISVHECMHAATASWLGDDTGRHLGRVTLNPVSHFDPMGAIMFLLIALGLPALAWGKPVPVNQSRLRPLGRFGRQGSMAVVALAGPFSNVVMGAFAAAVLKYMLDSGQAQPQLVQFLWIFVIVNFGLAAFNMIPLPPLDGSRLLTALLPPFWRPVLAPLERYGIMLLFLLILLGGGIGSSIIGGITEPVRQLLFRLFAPWA
ncbi:MAG: site-2 protease family protein [Thermomicrobiales bacterium]